MSPLRVAVCQHTQLATEGVARRMRRSPGGDPSEPAEFRGFPASRDPIRRICPLHRAEHGNVNDQETGHRGWQANPGDAALLSERQFVRWL